MTEQKPLKAVEKSSKKNSASVAITERAISRKPSVEKVEEPKSRRSARGRSRYRSETTEQPAELEKNEEPKSTKRDKIKPENTVANEKKNDVKKVEKVDKEKEAGQKENENEKEIKEEKAAEKEEEEEEEEKTSKPWKTSSVKKLQQKVAAAKNDAEKWKQDRFESKRRNLPKSDKRNSDESEPKERDSEQEPETKKSRTSSPSADERRNGRKYHDIQIVQLESEIEEDGKYRYK